MKYISTEKILKMNKQDKSNIGKEFEHWYSLKNIAAIGVKEIIVRTSYSHFLPEDYDDEDCEKVYYLFDQRNDFMKRDNNLF